MPIGDWLILTTIAIPIAFLMGRYSTRVVFFHTKSAEKLSVPEFMKSHS